MRHNVSHLNTHTHTNEKCPFLIAFDSTKEFSAKLFLFHTLTLYFSHYTIHIIQRLYLLAIQHIISIE